MVLKRLLQNRSQLLLLELVRLEAVEELVEIELNLAGLPQVGSKALQVNLHVVDLVYLRKTLVEVK